MATININADTGDDGTGDGSSDSPYETLAHAFDQSSSGDTIYCQNSTASYDFVDDTFDHDITIEGQSYDGAVFDADSVQLQNWIVSDNVTFGIKYLTIQNVLNTDGNNQHVIHLPSSFDFIATGCVFKDIKTRAEAPAGVVFGSSGTGVKSVLLQSCVFDNIECATNTGSRRFCVMNIGGCSEGSTWEAYNNTFYFKTSGATVPVDGVFHIYGDVSDNLTTTVKNNIFKNDTGTKMNIFDGYGDPDLKSIATFDHNCYETDDWNVDDGGGADDKWDVTETNSLTEDPLLVDPANSNFKLQPTSPCIEAGTTI